MHVSSVAISFILMLIALAVVLLFLSGAVPGFDSVLDSLKNAR